MRGRLVLPLALAAVAIGAPAGASAMTATPPRRADLRAATPYSVHDRVLPRAGAVRFGASSHPTGFGGTYTTPSGDHVTVHTAPSYTPNPALNQAYANFFSSLVHGSELGLLKVYVLPYSDMKAVCGDPDADSCYSPSDNEIALLGTPTPGHVPIAELAAHEYGHHIANHRTNSPWPAGDWGPKWWASYQAICPGVAKHRYFPGNTTNHYDLDPGEVWAETNRVLNGGTTPWNIVTPALYPNAQALSYARRDILHPWTHRTVSRFSGRLVHAKQATRKLGTFLDGRLSAKLVTTHGRLDGDLYLYDHKTGKLLGRSAHAGGSESKTVTVCGQSAVDAVVSRYRGSGSWRLRVIKP